MGTANSAVLRLYDKDHIPVARPLYELRVRGYARGEVGIEIWQIPCDASPHITKPLRIAGLRGRNMALVEPQVLRMLRRAGIHIAPKMGVVQHIAIDEDLSLTLGLFCRVLAPMRSAERMRMAAYNIEHMNRDEAGYWLGMAMYRKNPRRVLQALRIILSDPDIEVGR